MDISAFILIVKHVVLDRNRSDSAVFVEGGPKQGIVSCKGIVTDHHVDAALGAYIITSGAPMGSAVVSLVVRKFIVFHNHLGATAVPFVIDGSAIVRQEYVVADKLGAIHVIHANNLPGLRRVRTPALLFSK
jgi:hypothetical protein